MKNIFYYIRMKHVQIMILGIVTIIIGLFLGISMDGNLLIRNISLKLGFPIGMSMLLYGGFNRVYENKKALLKKCIIFTGILFLVLCITPIISKTNPKYSEAILVATISFGVVLIEGKNKNR